MDREKEWFTLREVAELWRPVDASGVPLTGTAAIDAVLKLIYLSVTGVRLQASYNLATPIQSERLMWVKDGGGWEPFDLRGIVNIRFRHDHIRTDDGLIWIHADDGCDGVPNELLILPDNPKVKVRIPLQHSIVAEDEHFGDSVVTLDEAGLLVSKEALADYALKRGRDDVLKRLDGPVVVQPVPPAEEVEQGKAKSKSKTGKTKKPRKDRSEFWSLVEQWVRNRRMSGQPGIDDFRQAVRASPGNFAVDGRIDEHPSPDSDGKRFYYCLASGAEVPEGTVKNRISEFYRIITK